MTVPALLERLLEGGGVLLAAVAIVLVMRLQTTVRAVRRQLFQPRKTIPAPQATFSIETHNLSLEVRRLNDALEQVRRELDGMEPRNAHSIPSAQSVSISEAAAGPEDAIDTSLLSALRGESMSNRRPVEFDGEALRLSRSLSALGSLVRGSGQSGTADVYLNDQVEIDHVAFERWSALFDFRSGRPYSRYRTVRPATVTWHEEAGSGKPLSPGIAEMIS